MREIMGKAKTVRELLNEVKYSIDYYQREYNWRDKQIKELIEDLCGRFLNDYEPEHSRDRVADYGHYFLGSIIISRKDNANFIVDGQQRLTSLTLLLIYLNNLQKNRSETVNIEKLIFSERYSVRSFNLQVDERIPCMEELFNQHPFDENNLTESVQNILTQYHNIEQYFPEKIAEQALPYFIDWLIDNVHLVEITAYSDDDAYTIFETMNDRGLSLTPTEMLKGYLLANISDARKKVDANTLWKGIIRELNDLGKDIEADCFKAWLRSQYATKIREKKAGAIAENFDKMGTEYHRWVRDNREMTNLNSSDDYFNFINTNFKFYSNQYIKIINVSRELTPGYEHVLYNAHHGFTLQYMLLLAPLKPDDSNDTIKLKIQLVARFIDILLNRRIWNSKSIAYSTLQYTMFNIVKDIRGMSPLELSNKLRTYLDNENIDFTTNDRLYLHQQNRKYLHRILARVTDCIEQMSGMSSRYMEYVTYNGKTRYEVEHIWADKPERHTDEFDHPTDFSDYRNRIGGLLLLPRKFNGSYGAKTYEEKLPHYFSQNLLAKSLNPQCYEHNPGFLHFVEQTGLPFQPHNEFKKKDLDARGDLYKRITKQVWNPNDLRIE